MAARKIPEDTKVFHYHNENPKNNWTCIKRDWTQCPQLWALDKTMLPDPETGIIRPYSTYVLSLMPKALKQEMFPNNPEMWFEGEMSIEDFKTPKTNASTANTGSKPAVTEEAPDKNSNKPYSWLDKIIEQHKAKTTGKNDDVKTPTKIAEEAGILPNHISKVLRELKETGMVECINEEARKRRLYRLTAVGEEVVEKLD